MKLGSNNTNKLSPQEQRVSNIYLSSSSNNTNKLSPQELFLCFLFYIHCSNNTNKLSPQEPLVVVVSVKPVQIIQINLVLKNIAPTIPVIRSVQIIQINLVLKNCRPYYSIFMLYLQYILSISIIKC